MLGGGNPNMPGGPQGGNPPGQDESSLSQFAGALGSGFGANAATQANPFQDAINIGANNLNPWLGAGQNAVGNEQNALNYMSNPNQFYQNMMQGWQMSPQAQQQVQQGIKSANAASAASGMLGSGAEQVALQKEGQAITSADQQQYLQNRMNIWNNYLRGESAMSGQGMQAGESINDLVERMRTAMMQQEAAKAAEKAKKGSGSGALIGGIAGGALGSVFPGVGTMLGAGIGSGIGGAIGENF